ncbi:MAG: CvpA family protein [Bacteroidales bacterium]|nr:CvpA family protein [Bacteroidales bacterium]
MVHLTTIDLIILSPILYGLIRGWMRGFFVELGATIGVILAIIATRLLTNTLCEHVAQLFNTNPTITTALSGATIFILALIGVRFACKALKKTMKAINLGFIDTWAGAALGALKYVLVVSICLNIITLFNNATTPERNDKLEQSISYHPVKLFVPSIVQMLQ